MVSSESDVKSRNVTFDFRKQAAIVEEVYLLAQFRFIEAIDMGEMFSIVGDGVFGVIPECQVAYRLIVEVATTHDGNPAAQTAEDYVVNPA